MRNPAIPALAAALALLGLAAAGAAGAQPPRDDAQPAAPAGKSASPGAKPAPRTVTHHEVWQALENLGYTQISLRQDKDGWSGIATRKGKRVLLDIDRHGTVRETE
jgi:hypothetical protein